MQHSRHHEGNPQDCPQPQEQDKHSGAQACQTEPTAKKPMSERKLQANRKNAQKSTGPKTARGKRYSSFNAMTHGMLAKKVMYAADGKLIDEDLRRVHEQLREELSRGDVVSELLTELVAVDYWHLQKGLECERKYLSPKGGDFHPQGAMPTLTRYMTANRRALEKTLTTLMQLRAQSAAAGKATAKDDSNPVTSSPLVSDGNDELPHSGSASHAGTDEAPSATEDDRQEAA